MKNSYSKYNNHSRSIIAIAVLIATLPNKIWAIELAQSPPGKVDPYVAPNVILSLDNSTSMSNPMDNGSSRMEVLKSALRSVFIDDKLLPDNKIRLGWQVMHNNTKNLKDIITPLDSAAAHKALDSKNQNLLRILDEEHRKRFIDFIEVLDRSSGTPTHKMVSQADAYMRASIHQNGPWADIPGKTLSKSDRLPLGCRRNYHILLTDGEWNNSGGNIYHSTPTVNYDGTSKYLPDTDENIPNLNKVYYDITKAETQIYRDTDFADNNKSVIADWAFYSWAKPLQLSSNLTGTIKPKATYLTAKTEKFSNSNTSNTKVEIDIEPFWNPRYNPATWPHMSTFTIGFSSDAIPNQNYTSSTSKSTSINHPSSMLPYGYDGDFVHYAKGTYKWYASKDKAHDMWHAAINGRGEFHAVAKADDLKKAFESIIGTINVASEPDRSSAATSGTSSERTPVGTYITFNEPKDAWNGGVKSTIIEKGIETPAWGGKSTAEILENIDQENRTIISWNNEAPIGIPFRWSNINTTQKTALQVGESTTDNNGEKRLNYLRGDRSNELSKNGIFRNRFSKQGDIVNSNVWYTGKPISNYNHPGYNKFITDYKNREPMIYVGGNDGMLHGFSATDGSEKIAYIPNGVYKNLSRLTWPTYDLNHRYYVDGSPMTGDVDIGTKENPNWRTLLVGTLGAGGKGFFILDVTNPSNFNEDNASTLVVMDKTSDASNSNIQCSDTNSCLDNELADIGHIFGIPATEETSPLQTSQIALLNNNRWAAIMGNGYNSYNERPVLLIQYLDNKKELLRIPATPKSAAKCTTEQLAKEDKSFNDECHNVTDNGLSAPRLVDINGDGRPDIVYAGDLKGNLWKFYIGSKDPDQWDVAFNEKPLYTAVGGIQGNSSTRIIRQSITVAPTVRANDRSYISGSGVNQKFHKTGGMMVSFGTGRNISPTDPENTDINTLYSIIDNTRYLNNLDQDDKKYYVSIHPGDTNNSIPAPEKVGIGITKLASKKFNTSTTYTGKDLSSGMDFWASDSVNSSKLDWSTHKGWYLDFPEMGERLLKPMNFYDGSNILAVYSQVPFKGSNHGADANTESCEPSTVVDERQFLTLINIMDGNPPGIQIMDTNGDGIYDLTTDSYASRMKIAKGAHTRIIGDKHITDIGKEQKFNLARMPEQSMRPSWRQLK